MASPRPSPTPNEPTWDAVAELLDQVLAVPPAQQAATLEAHCQAHPDLAEELTHRLAALESLGLLEDPDTAARSWSVPQRIGEFALRERLGAGGMGVVFRARQESLGRDVALKLLRPELALFEHQRQRLQREAEVVAQLDHPHIVPVFASGAWRGIPYLAMHFVEGRSLAEIVQAFDGRDAANLDGAAFVAAFEDLIPGGDRVAVTGLIRGRSASWSTVTAALLLPVVDALAHAHAKAVVHRDVKPSNVMLSSAGRVQLLDFGLASFGDHGSLTRSGAMLGTLSYMAPEQIEAGVVDARSDVFAVGAVLYEMLALEPAFESATAGATVHRIVRRDPVDVRQRNARADPSLVAIINKCLEKRADRRYAGAAALAAELRAFLEGRPIQAELLTPWRRLQRYVRREPLRAAVVALAVACLALLAGGAGYWLAQRETLARGRTTLQAERREHALSQAFLAWFEGDHAAARRSFDRALEIAPESAPARVGRHLVDQGAGGLSGDATADLTAAERHFVAGTTRLAQKARGDRDAARAAQRSFAEALLASRVARPRYHGGLARAAALAGDTETAAAAARQLRALWPRSAMAAYWAGYAALEVDAARAVAHLRRALELEPTLERARAQLGAALLLTGPDGRDEALRVLRAATEQAPTNVAAWLQLGVAQLHAGDLDAAEVTLRRATSLPNTRPGAFYNLGVVLAQRDPAAALEPLARAVEIAPDYAEAWHNLGVLHDRLGNHKAAVRAFSTLTTLRAHHPPAWQGLARARAAAGDAPGAAEAYARVVALKPNDADAHRDYCALLEYLRANAALSREHARFAGRTSGGQSPDPDAPGGQP
ncbi:MAG: protein kinase [Planctomycetota bacterium]